MRGPGERSDGFDGLHSDLFIFGTQRSILMIYPYSPSCLPVDGFTASVLRAAPEVACKRPRASPRGAGRTWRSRRPRTAGQASSRPAGHRSATGQICPLRAERVVDLIGRARRLGSADRGAHGLAAPALAAPRMPNRSATLLRNTPPCRRVAASAHVWRTWRSVV